MSREIKFRAWDSYNESLVKVLELKFDAKIAYVESLRELNEGERYDISFDNLKLLQYTGLKDMNGVDIYEGDVISDNISMVGVVEFKKSAYRVNYKNNSCKWFIDYIESEIKTIEIIGNIYENKNLLEEK